MSKQLLFAVLIVSLLMQVWIATRPDTMGDVLVYRDWCRALTKHGIAEAYSKVPILESRGTGIDYPPVYAYLLMLLGKTLNFFAPELFWKSDSFVDSSIKLLSVLANILIAILLFVELKERKEILLGVAAAAAYAFNPAAIFNTAYWGQSESISALLVLGSLILFRRGYPEWSWVIMIVTLLLKPVALPFLPLILLATAKEFGWKRIVTSAGAAAIIFLLIFLPFLMAGRFEAIVRTLMFQIDAMPYLSVNAHNLWWIIQRGRPWVIVTSYWKILALLLFGAFYFASLFLYWISRKKDSLYVAAASIAFGFFMLYTHMHENHLFQFIPLLSLFCFEDSNLRKVYLLVTLTFFANMVLHDPFINHVIAPYSIGPKVAGWEGTPEHYQIYDTFIREGKSYVVQETTGDISVLRLILTLVNSQLNCLIFFYWLYAFYFRGSYDEPRFPEPVFTKNRLLLVVFFVVATEIPFLVKLSAIS